jgi:hypothetical protein
MMHKSALRLGSMLHKFSVPRDGVRRYMYDIWQPLTLLIVTIWFMAFFFTTSSSFDAMGSIYYGQFFCNADGKLEGTESYHDPLWDPQLYFTINIAFGKFPFSSAKVIDAAWDAVVGRGGQFVAAAVAYRTLRRSFTLTMETCTVMIPAVASLYCRQIQLESVSQLIHTMFWHWSSGHLRWRQAIHMGRLRLCTQLFACIYVLLFATLGSVMSGYRAELSAITSYEGDGAGPLFPVNRLVRPRIGFNDGVRVGLSDTPMFAHDAIVYPGGVGDTFDRDGSSLEDASYSVSEFLASSRDFREPWGILVDCQSYACCLHLPSPS